MDYDIIDPFKYSFVCSVFAAVIAGFALVVMIEPLRDKIGFSGMLKSTPALSINSN